MARNLRSASQTATAEPSIPELRGLRDPKDLRELANLTLKDANFHTWKHLMMAEFQYYGIDKIIDGSHLPPTTGNDQRRWIEIEQLFNRHLILHTSPALYQMISQKDSLREKWLAILQRNSSTDSFKNTRDLLTIKLETKDTVDSFIIRLQYLWDELENHGRTFTEADKIEQLMAKMEAVYPTETRELWRNQDIRPLTWDHVTLIYREAEQSKPTSQSSAGAGLAVGNSSRKPRSDQAFNNYRGRSYNPQSRKRRGRGRSRSRSRDKSPDRSHARSRSRSRSRDRGRDRSRDRDRRSRSQDRYSRRSNPRIRCFFCEERGHMVGDCPAIKELRELRKLQKDKTSEGSSKPAGMAGFAHLDQDDDVNYHGHTF